MMNKVENCYSQKYSSSFHHVCGTVGQVRLRSATIYDFSAAESRQASGIIANSASSRLHGKGLID